MASLAFNVGVGGTFGVRAYQNHWEAGAPGGPEGVCADGSGRHGQRLSELLGLTPQQADQMSAARQEMKEAGADLRRELHQADQTLADLMAAAEPDREAIDGQLARIGELRHQMQHHLVDHFLKVKELLEADQQETFNDIIRRRMVSYDRYGPGHGGPRGHKRGKEHSRRWGRGPSSREPEE